jgi:hypothetical protein
MPKRKSKVRNPKRGVALMMAGGFFIMMAFVVFLVAMPRMRDESRGARKITEAELAKLGDQPPTDLIVFDASSVTDTGFVERRRGSVVCRYLLVQVGTRWALAAVPYTHSGNQMIGYIKPLDSASAIDSQARDETAKKFPNQPLTPYFFRITDGRSTQSTLLAAAFCLLLGTGVLIAGFVQRNS